MERGTLLMISSGGKTFVGKYEHSSVDGRCITLSNAMNFLEFPVPGSNGEIRSLSTLTPVLGINKSADRLPNIEIFPNSIVIITEDMEFFRMYETERMGYTSNLIVPNKGLELLKT